MEPEPVIGLEIHAQLATATTIFCGCAVRAGEGSKNDLIRRGREQ